MPGRRIGSVFGDALRRCISAVTNFNSVAEFAVDVARRCLCVPTGHYYDDFFTVDPHSGGDSAKRALTRLMARLGFPYIHRPFWGRLSAPRARRLHDTRGLLLFLFFETNRERNFVNSDD